MAIALLDDRGQKVNIFRLVKSGENANAAVQLPIEPRFSDVVISLRFDEITVRCTFHRR